MASRRARGSSIDRLSPEQGDFYVQQGREAAERGEKIEACRFKGQYARKCWRRGYRQVTQVNAEENKT